MKNLKIGAWLLVLWIFQTVFLKYLEVGGITPEILFLFVVAHSSFEGDIKRSAAVGAICGIIAETSSPIAGFYLAAYTLSALLVSLLKELIYNNPYLIIFVSSALLSIFKNSLFFFLNHEILGEITYFKAFISLILPTVLLNVIPCGIIGVLVKKTLYAKKKIRRRF